MSGFFCAVAVDVGNSIGRSTVESGAARTGQWLHYRRDLVADLTHHGQEVVLARGLRPQNFALSMPQVSHLDMSPITSEAAIASVAKIGESGSCENDIVCRVSPTTGFLNAEKAVARMLFTKGQLKPWHSVLIFGIENIKDLRILRKYLRTRRIALFTWNPVIDYQQNHQVRQLHIQQLKGLGFHIFTFDPDDAQRYGLTLTQQVYRSVESFRQEVPAEWDIYFLGQDKNRFDTLRALALQWQPLG